jgi:hypothetical protein
VVSSTVLYMSMAYSRMTERWFRAVKLGLGGLSRLRFTARGRFFAQIAQMAELRVCNAVVAGSIPALGPTKVSGRCLGSTCGPQHPQRAALAYLGPSSLTAWKDRQFAAVPMGLYARA